MIICKIIEFKIKTSVPFDLFARITVNPRLTLTCHLPELEMAPSRSRQLRCVFTVRSLGVSVNQSQYRMAALGRTQANAQNHKQASAELFHTNTNCTLYWYKTHKERHIAGHILGTMKFGTSHIYSLHHQKDDIFLWTFVANKSLPLMTTLKGFIGGCYWYVLCFSTG